MYVCRRYSFGPYLQVTSMRDLLGYSNEHRPSTKSMTSPVIPLVATSVRCTSNASAAVEMFSLARSASLVHAAPVRAKMPRMAANPTTTIFFLCCISSLLGWLLLIPRNIPVIASLNASTGVAVVRAHRPRYGSLSIGDDLQARDTDERLLRVLLENMIDSSFLLFRGLTPIESHRSLLVSRWKRISCEKRTRYSSRGLYSMPGSFVESSISPNSIVKFSPKVEMNPGLLIRKSTYCRRKRAWLSTMSS